jgi:predicted transcriptional regulator
MPPHRLQEIHALIEDIRQRLDKLEAEAEKMIPEKEWYSRKEFAERVGIKPKTVSNYLANRRYGEKQRKKNGRWQIHRSALDD